MNSTIEFEGLEGFEHGAMGSLKTCVVRPVKKGCR